MKIYGKKMATALLLCAMCAPVLAGEEEDKKVDANVGADLVSAYIWRGQKCGGVSVQPTAGLSWRGLSLGAWGSYAIAPEKNGTDEELDITLGYSIKGFSVGITDYYFFNSGHPFFKYGGLGESSHTFEGTVGYDFGFLSVAWSTNFAGNDGVNGKGKRAYSSYLQLDAPFKLGPLNWNATVGAVPYCTDFYADDDSHGFHINQVGLRAEYAIDLKHVSIPLYGQMVANPSSRGLYFLCGVAVSMK